MTPMNDEIEGGYGQLRCQLEQSETALLRGNRATLFRHGRWHYLTLGDQVGGKGIQALHFLSSARAESLKVDWLVDGAQPVAYAHVSPIWSAEVAEKVLPTTAAYRPLLLTGRATLVRVQRQIRSVPWAARRAVGERMKRPFCPSWRR